MKQFYRKEDQIIVLDKGKIESVGRHDDLLKKSDIYKEFIFQREKALMWRMK